MDRLQELLNHSLDRDTRNYSLPIFHLKALDKLGACRTSKLGGHAQYCEDGHLNGVWYNSCKHRFCPRCNQINKERWIINSQRMLLNCPHHHIVFTIASELNALWQYNRVLMSDLLFQCVKDTLKRFSKDSRYLNAMPGVVLALHTWGRDMSLHPHIHALVSHGGLNEQGVWVEPRKQHLFPQKPVMLVFRGLYLSRLKQLVREAKLNLPQDQSVGATLNALHRLYRKDWVVHFSDRYDHARGVAKYLGRYIKGGPLKPQQVVRVTDHVVKFQFRSHKTKRVESIELSREAFVRRLLEHVALPGKPSLRYSGLYVSSVRERLNRAREQLNQPPIGPKLELDWVVYLEKQNALPVCRECGKFLTVKGSMEALH